MSTMTLTVNDGVHVLNLTNGDSDNTLTLDVLAEYHAVLDQIVDFEGNTALLLICDHKKTFSTGVNLEWLTAQDETTVARFWESFERLLSRLTLLDAPTVAGINGNCYAGGALLACACDFRVMRSDRGRFCLPEVNINIPLTPLMIDCVDNLPNKQAVKLLSLTGVAYTGEQCKAVDVVDSIWPHDELQEQAFTLAKNLSQKDRATYAAIKQGMRLGMVRHGLS